MTCFDQIRWVEGICKINNIDKKGRINRAHKG